MDQNDDGHINGIEFAAIAARYNTGASASYSGPIVWNAKPASDLYYSSNWQVLEEDTTPITGASTYISDQYVWTSVSSVEPGQAYVDEMVLRDRASGNATNDYGNTGSAWMSGST